MGVLKYEMNNEQLLFCDEMKILNLICLLKFSISFSHDLVWIWRWEGMKDIYVMEEAR